MITAPTLHVGSPTQAGPLTTFPIWTDAPTPARPVRTVPPKGARIREQAEGSTAAALTYRDDAVLHLGALNVRHDLVVAA